MGKLVLFWRANRLPLVVFFPPFRICPAETRFAIVSAGQPIFHFGGSAESSKETRPFPVRELPAGWLAILSEKHLI